MSISVPHQPEVGWEWPKVVVGQGPDDCNDGGGDQHSRSGESDVGDEADPDGREQDATYACSIERETERLRAIAIEPARDHGIDGRAARRGPARTRQQRSGEELPRRLRHGPNDDTERTRQRA